jgi:hypothetical protein
VYSTPLYVGRNRVLGRIAHSSTADVLLACADEAARGSASC